MEKFWIGSMFQNWMQFFIICAKKENGAEIFPMFKIDSYLLHKLIKKLKSFHFKIVIFCLFLFEY